MVLIITTPEGPLLVRPYLHVRYTPPPSLLHELYGVHKIQAESDTQHRLRMSETPQDAVTSGTSRLQSGCGSDL